MNKKQKGDVAELKVALRCVELGWVCNKPMSVARYDLVLDDNKRLYRAQVKYVDADSHSSDGAVAFTCGNGPDAPQTYTASEIDVLIAYLPRIEKLIWIPPDHFDGKYSIHIRLEPPRNNQKKGIFLAEDHYW